VLQSLKLLLPVFIPSWQFFREVGPSPRIEFCLATTKESLGEWQEFDLRAQSKSWLDLLFSIFFNARWNEALYIMNCAERLVINPTEHSSQEIISRMIIEFRRKGLDLSLTPYLQYRLVFVSREGDELRKDVLFVSKIEELHNEL